MKKIIAMAGVLFFMDQYFFSFHAGVTRLIRNRSRLVIKLNPSLQLTSPT